LGEKKETSAKALNTREERAYGPDLLWQREIRVPGVGHSRISAAILILEKLFGGKKEKRAERRRKNKAGGRGIIFDGG